MGGAQDNLNILTLQDEPCNLSRPCFFSKTGIVTLPTLQELLKKNFF